jgi:hypothetical protein
MIEDGKITAEEAMTLIKAIEDAAEGEVEVIEPESGSGAGRSAGPEFEEVKARAKKYAKIPLGIGVAFIILSAYWMYALVQNVNYGFWFFCAWFPLLLGIFLVTVSAGGMNSRWLYVNVDQVEDEWPQHITFGFPIPLGIISWSLRNFGHFIRGKDKKNVDELLMALSLADKLDDPLIVNVDEGENGDRVQVYIG